MSRTPSMTVTAAESQIGYADDLIVTSENRSLLRIWANARNPGNSRLVSKMSSVELANLYRQYGPVRGERTLIVAAPVAPAVKPSAAQNTAAEQLAELIRAITGKGNAILDETRAREIVAEMIEAAEPKATVTRLEVKTAAAVNVIEGIVHNLTSKIIKIAALAHPVMLVGPAGCGKTTIGEHVAVALGLPFYITSTVFDTHELMGFVDGYGKYHTTPFRQAFEHGGVWVADEIDAWDAAALLAANSALANGLATFPDRETPVKRHANFRIIATANTFGHGADRIYVGRNELDAASLDRFATFSIDYDDNLENMLCGGNIEWLAHVRKIRNAVRAKNIRHVVSTRAIIMGSQALAVGMDFDDVNELYVFKGMSATDKAKINA